MSRLTEYTVSAGRRASWRRAASPTRKPSGVKLTIEGRSLPPSRSGITTGRPVRSSTKATRLLVVPRSIPTIRDMRLLFTQGGGQVVDHGPEIRSRGQRVREPVQRRRPVGRRRRVPRLAQRACYLALG